MTLAHIQIAHDWAIRASAIVVWYVSQDRHVISFGIILCPKRHAACHSALLGEFIALTGICLN